MKQKLLSLLFLLMGMVQGAMAQKEAYVASDDYWNTVTFYYDDQKTVRSQVAEINNNYVDYWNPDQYPPHPYTETSKVVFDASFADYRPTSTAYWFCGCYYLSVFSGLENLNTSEVTDMSYMFDGCSGVFSDFDFSKLNTANVKSMRSMFHNCEYGETLDLSSFNTEKVTDMSDMFNNCYSLQHIYVDGAKWTTANVADGSNMFKDCPLLIGGNGTTYDENHLGYEYACIDKSEQPGYFTSFDAPRPYGALNFDYEKWIITLTYYYDTEKANRSDVVELSGARFLATRIVFDTSFSAYRPTSTRSWFSYCSDLTSISGMENLNTSNVKDMSNMFSGCESLEELDLSGFNTSNVKDMSYMFSGCKSLEELDLSSFNTSNVTNMAAMFKSCSSLTSINLSSFNTENVTYMNKMFNECSNLTNLDLSSFNTEKVTSLEEMFNWCPALTNLNLSSFNTANATNMYRMFYNCKNLTNLDLSSFDTENVTDMSDMFCRCASLTTIYADEEKWKTDKMYYTGENYQGYGGSQMFRDCSNLIGGNGTLYDSSHTDAEYARIDKPGQPGYLTQKTSSGIKTIEQSAITVDHYYTLDGRRFEGLPTEKGLYIINGKKIVVK